MSRRYGRNQKRAAREREAALAGDLADAKDQLYALSALMADVRAERDKLKWTMDRARYLLGDHVALPPRHRGNHPLPLGGDFNAAAVTCPPIRLRDYMDEAATQPTKIRTTRMLELAAEVRKNNRMQEVHCYVTLDSGQVAYALSAETIERRSKEHLEALLETEIAPALARALASDLKQSSRRRYW